MEESIEGLDKQTDMWKYDVAAKLFINIHGEFSKYFIILEFNKLILSSIILKKYGDCVF